MSLKWLDKKRIISFLLETNFDESPARVAHKAATLFEVVFEAEDGIRDLVRSRGLGDVYKRQIFHQSNLKRHLLSLLQHLQ